MGSQTYTQLEVDAMIQEAVNEQIKQLIEEIESTFAFCYSAEGEDCLEIGEFEWQQLKEKYVRD